MKYRQRVRGYAELPGSRILPNAKNYRLHGDQQRGALRGMLAEVGVADAVLVRPDDPAALQALRALPTGDPKAFGKWLAGYRGDFVLLDGHLRVDEVRDQPMPALILDCDDEEADKVLATLDNITKLAGFDAEMFRSLTQDLNFSSPDVADFIGLVAATEARMHADSASLDAVLGSSPLEGDAANDGGSNEAGEGSDDEAQAERERRKAALNAALEQVDEGPEVTATEELRRKWGCEKGQLWVIPSLTVPGQEHRLLCGDSTKREDVLRLMNGRRAALMQTDPPYGVDYVQVKAGIPVSGLATLAGRFDDIANDDLKEEQLEGFLRSVLQAAILEERAAVYLWHPSGPLSAYFFGAMLKEAYVVHRTIIWAKKIFVLTRSGMYHWQHEPCLYGWKKGNQCPWYGDKSQSTLWTCERDDDRNMHPTQKPVLLWVRALMNHTQQGEVAYEPFSGSGGQFLACEQLGRLCYGNEMSPGYVAVALERMAARGLTPRLAEPAPAAKAAA